MNVKKRLKKTIKAKFENECRKVTINFCNDEHKNIIFKISNHECGSSDIKYVYYLLNETFKNSDERIPHFNALKFTERIKNMKKGPLKAFESGSYMLAPKYFTEGLMISKSSLCYKSPLRDIDIFICKEKYFNVWKRKILFYGEDVNFIGKSNLLSNNIEFTHFSGKEILIDKTCIYYYLIKTPSLMMMIQKDIDDGPNLLLPDMKNLIEKEEVEFEEKEVIMEYLQHELTIGEQQFVIYLPSGLQQNQISSTLLNEQEQQDPPLHSFCEQQNRITSTMLQDLSTMLYEQEQQDSSLLMNQISSTMSNEQDQQDPPPLLMDSFCEQQYPPLLMDSFCEQHNRITSTTLQDSEQQDSSPEQQDSSPLLMDLYYGDQEQQDSLLKNLYDSLLMDLYYSFSESFVESPVL